MNFLIKYKPKNLNEIRGNRLALENLKEHVTRYRKGKAALLHGGNGVGKTASVYALANELNYEVIETNASNYRNKNQIESIIGESSKQASLFKKGRIILVDDVDSLNIKDRGGLQALNKIIVKSEWPIVLTAIDAYNSKLKTVRSKSKLIEFKKLGSLEVYEFLKDICEKEEIKFDEDLLKKVSRKANGDLRAGINDLQNLIVDDELKEEEYGGREHKESIFDALKLVLKGKDAKMLLGAFSKTDLDLDECFLWMDENLPKEYFGEDLKKSYEIMSKVDVFKGRIRRQQYYRFLVYINNLLTAGIGLSKKEKNNNYVMYKRPSRILKMWIAKMKYGKKKAIAEKIADKTHLSVKKVLRDFNYYVNFLIDKDVIHELELDVEEVKWLRR